MLSKQKSMIFFIFLLGCILFWHQEAVPESKFMEEVMRSSVEYQKSSNLTFI